MKLISSIVSKCTSIKVLESSNTLVANSVRVLDSLEILKDAIESKNFSVTRMSISYTNEESTESLYLDSEKATKLFKLLVNYSSSIAHEFVGELED